MLRQRIPLSTRRLLQQIGWLYVQGVGQLLDRTEIGALAILQLADVGRIYARPLAKLHLG